MRLVNRSTVLFLGSIATAGLVACGDDGGGGGGVDPSGTDNTFVVSRVKIPETPNEATMQLGLDIDGLANDGVDNNLGTLLASIRSVAPSLDLQGSLDTQVDQGGIILLSNVKAKALDNASRVGMWIYVGANPTPPACMDASDMTCRKHLTGSGSFEIEAGSQTDAFLAGNIVGGKFTGGPGTVTLQIALGEGQPIDLPLQLARAEMNVSANGIATGSKLGGAIAKSDLDTKVYPAIHMTVADLVERDCPPPRSGANCNCAANSTGLSVLGFLDTDNNCEITVAEVQGTVDQLLTLDIDLDGNMQNDAVSLGVGVTAVVGSFPVPASN